MNKRLEMDHMEVSYGPREDRARREILRTAASFLFFALGVISVMETFLSYFHPTMNRSVYWLEMLLLITLVFLGCCVQKARWLLPGICGMFILTVVIKWKEMVNGLLVLVNAILEAVEESYNLNAGALPLISDAEAGADWSIFLLMFITILTLGLCIFRKRRFFPALFLVLPMTLYGLFFNAMPDLFWCVLALGFIIAFSVMQKKNSVRIWCLSALGIMAVALAAFGILRIFVPPYRYTRLPIFDKIYDVSADWLDSIGDAMGISTDAGNDGRSRLGIGGGKLGTVGFSGSGMDEVFKIRTCRPDSNLYLKSYLGMEYRNNSWNPLPSRYANSELAQRIEKLSQSSRLNSYNQSYYIDSLVLQKKEILFRYFSSPEHFYQTHLRRWVILSDSVGKYYYIPYGGNFDGEFISFDAYPLNAAEDKRYDFIIHTEEDYHAYKRLTDEYNEKDREVAAYIQWEKAYREFVYEAYTRIPDGILDGLDLPVDYKRQRSGREVDAYIKEIQKMFESYTYNLSPEPMGSGEDFVRHFLTVREGYCTGFASAGVIMLRSAGIPARYVEGYCLSPDEIHGIGLEIQGILDGQMQPYIQYYVPVYVKDAHSWVEIYRDGYGWVPVEFTLGYGSSGQGSDETRPVQPGSQSQDDKDEDDDNDDDNDDEDNEDDEENTQDSRGKDNINPSSGGSAGPRWIVLVSVILGVLLSAGLAVFFWLLGYRKKCMARDELLYGKEERADRVTALWRYMEKLLAQKGCVRDFNENYEELAKEAVQSFCSFTEQEMHDIIETVLMVRFSGRSAEPAHCRLLQETAVKMRREIYEGKGKWEKFVLKYIKVY